MGFVEISGAEYPALGSGYTIAVGRASDGGVSIANRFGSEEDNIAATGLTFTPPRTFTLHNVVLKGAYVVTLSGTIVCGT